MTAGSAAIASAQLPVPPVHPIVKPVKSTKTATKKPPPALEKATPVAPPKVDATVKPPASNCDPFSSMHNCDNK